MRIHTNVRIFSTFLLAVFALAAQAETPVTVTGFNQDVVFENSATPAVTSPFDAGTACWFEAGLAGRIAGFPSTRVIESPVGAGKVRFQLAPYNASNALMISNNGTGGLATTGTLTLAAPARYSRISVLSSSGSGGGTNTIQFTYTTGAPVNSTYNCQDWGNNGSNALRALSGLGRSTQISGFYYGVNGTPSFGLYQTDFAVDSTRDLASITFTAAAPRTGIFAVSGTLLTSNVKYWNGTANGTNQDWNNAANWVDGAGLNGVPTATDIAYFPGNMNGATINLTVDQSIAGLATGGNLTINAGNILTVGASGYDVNGRLTMNAITGASVLTKTGAGTLVLTNGGNTHTATQVNQGRLTVTSNAVLGAGTVTLNGGTLNVGLAYTPGLLGKWYNQTPPNPFNQNNLLSTMRTFLNPLTPAVTVNGAPLATGIGTGGPQRNIFTYQEANNANADLSFTPIAGAPGGRDGFNTLDNIIGFFEGYIDIPVGGPTTFWTRSDDGSCLWLDDVDVPIVNNNFFQGQTTRTNTVNVGAGLHKIALSFYEGGGGAGFSAGIGPDFNNNAFGAFPKSMLLTAVGAPGSVTLTNAINVTAPSSISADFGMTVTVNSAITGNANLAVEGTGLTLNNNNSGFTGNMIVNGVAGLTNNGGLGATKGVVVGTLNLSNNLAVTTAIDVNGGTLASMSGTNAVSSQVKFNLPSNLSASGAATLTLAGGLDLTATSNATVVGAGNVNITGNLIGSAAAAYGSGLLEAIKLAANNGNADYDIVTGIFGYPRAAFVFGTSTVLAPWGTIDRNSDNETWVYTGQFLDSDGIFSFAENIDDFCRVTIDGRQALNDGGAGTITTSGAIPNWGMGPFGDGWHDIQFRFGNGGGGFGGTNNAGLLWGASAPVSLPAPYSVNGLKGFGLHNLNDANLTSTNGGFYTFPADGITDPLTGQVIRLRTITNGLTMNGTGLLTLSGAANTYRGQTTINSGTLVIGSVNAIPNSAPVLVNFGATLRVDQSDTITKVGGKGTIALNGGTLTVGDTSNFEFAGLISGNGGLTKVGSGQMSLTNPLSNTYTGTTVISAGSIRVMGGKAMGTSAVTLSGGNLNVDIRAGVFGEYFNQAPVNNQTKFGVGSWSVLNTKTGFNTFLNNLAPVVTAYSNINFGQDSAANSAASFASVGYNTTDNITARWRGSVSIPGGPLSLATTSDDGSAMWIDADDATPTADNNAFQGMTRRPAYGTTNLNFGTADWHDITVGFYEGGGGAGCVVDLWSAGSTTAVGGGAAGVANYHFILSTRYLQSGTPVFPNNITVSGAGGSIFNIGNALNPPSFNGTITLNSALTVNNSTATAVCLNGVISGGAGLNVTGPGVVTLGNSANTYGGATTLTAGTTVLGSPVPSRVYVADVLSDLVGLGNNAPVTSWPDSSSGNPAFSAITLNNPPTMNTATLLNGHKTVRFTAASQQSLQIPAAAMPAGARDDFTVAVVFRAASTGVGGNGQWYQNSGLVDAEEGGATNDWGIGWSSFNAVGTGIGNPDTSIYSAALNPALGHVAIFARQGGSLTQCVDGILTVAPSLADARTRNNTRVAIGSLQTALNYFDGDIAEVRIYDQALTGSQLLYLARSLGNRYGTAGGGTNNTLPDNTAVVMSAGATLFTDGKDETIGSLAGAGGTVAISNTLTVGNDNSSTSFSGNIFGVGALTKIGTGNFTLNSGTTMVGTFNVNNGTLTAGTSNVIADASSVVINGGTLDLGAQSDTVASVRLMNGTYTGTAGVLTSNSITLENGTVAGNLSGSNGITKNTAGTVQITSGANTYSGNTTITGGTLTASNAGGNAIPNTSMVDITAAGAALNLGQNEGIGILQGITGSIASVNTRTLTTGLSNGSATFSGNIVGTTGGVTKAGSGIQSLGGTNNYTGTTLVSAGTLGLVASNVMADTSTLTVNGGTFTVNTNNDTVGAVTLISGILAGTGTLTGASFDFQSGLVSCGIAGTNGINKTTSGQVDMNGFGLYTGSTNLNAGILHTMGGNPLANTQPLIIANVAGATLLCDSTTIVGSLSGGGALGGTVNVAAAQEFRTQGAGATSYDGTFVGGGTVSVRNNMLTVSRSSPGFTGTFTPTQLGELRVNSGVTLGGQVVSGNGTLSGTGTVGNVTINAAGRIAPGAGGTGTLNTGSLSILGLGIYECDIFGAPPSHDRINVTGDVQVEAGSSLIINNGGSFNPAHDTIGFTIVDNDSPGAPVLGSGLFNGLSNGSVINVGSAPCHIFSTGASAGDGDDIVIMPNRYPVPVFSTTDHPGGLSQPYVFMEGPTHNLAADATDPDGDLLTYAWSYQNVNIASDNGGLTGVSPVFGQLDGPNDYDLTLTVDDGLGGVVMADGGVPNQIHILNVDPSVPALTITPSNTPNINEGDTVTIFGSFDDPGALDTFTVTVDWGDNTNPTVVNVGASGDLTKLFGPIAHVYTDNDDGTAFSTRQIIVQVADDDIGANVALDTATVNDVAPVIALSGQFTNNTLAPYILTLGAVTDPGTDTQTQYIVHWGDGSPDAVFGDGINPVVNPGPISHSYSASIVAPIIVVDILDEDGLHLNCGSIQPPYVSATTLRATGDLGSSFSFDLITDGGLQGTQPLTLTISPDDTTLLSSAGLSVVGSTFTSPQLLKSGMLTTQVLISNPGGTLAVNVVITIRRGGGSGDTPQFKSKAVANPNPTQVGKVVEFSAVVVDSDGDIISIYWDFGDGTDDGNENRKLNAKHVYTAPGRYTVTCVADDGAHSQPPFSKFDIVVTPGALASDFQVTSAKLTFDFKTASRSQLIVIGTMTMPAGYVVGGSTINVQFLGSNYNQTFNMLSSGIGGDAFSQFTLKTTVPGATRSTGKFTMNLKGVNASNVTLFSMLSPLGFTNSKLVRPGADITMPMQITLQGDNAQVSPFVMNYTCVQNKKGTGKLKK